MQLKKIPLDLDFALILDLVGYPLLLISDDKVCTVMVIPFSEEYIVCDRWEQVKAIFFL